MSHRRTAAAVALFALVLTTAGCADDSDTATEDATDTASSSAANQSEAVVGRRSMTGQMSARDAVPSTSS